jgi:outer membrane protein assembly factor BamA
VQLNGKFFYLAELCCIFLLLSYSLQAQKDSSTTKHRLLFLPIIARSIETDWSFGAAVSSTFHLRSPNDSNTRTSNLQALALYSLKKQFVAAINGTIYFPGEKYILNQQISYSYYPDKFWGLGKATPDSNEEAYTYKQFYIYLHPQRLLSKSLFLGVIYEFQQVWDVRYQPGGLFDQENIVGRNGYRSSGLGLSITYDTRNNAFSPDHGVMLQFYFNHFDPIFASDYKYTNYVVDLRKFIRVYKHQILAIQAYGFFNGGEVPLRSLASFGGSNSMRGYYDGRFRDKNQVVLQAEYRVPLFWRLGVVGFAGCGNVSNYLNENDFTYVKYSFGGGIRIALNKAERLNLRLDYGIGQGHSSGFYFQLGEAF